MIVNVITFVILASLSNLQSASAQTGFDEKEKNIIKNVQKRIWWNAKKKIETLKLTESQRKEMDDILGLFITKNRKIKVNQSEEKALLANALMASNMAAIIEKRNTIANLFQQSVGRQIDMMANIVLLLTPEQKLTINQNYPNLFKNFWIRGAIDSRVKSKKRIKKPKKNKQ